MIIHTIIWLYSNLNFLNRHPNMAGSIWDSCFGYNTSSLVLGNWWILITGWKGILSSLRGVLEDHIKMKSFLDPLLMGVALLMWEMCDKWCFKIIIFSGVSLYLKTLLILVLMAFQLIFSWQLLLRWTSFFHLSKSLRSKSEDLSKSGVWVFLRTSGFLQAIWIDHIYQLCFVWSATHYSTFFRKNRWILIETMP